MRLVRTPEREAAILGRVLAAPRQPPNVNVSVLSSVGIPSARHNLPPIIGAAGPEAAPRVKLCMSGTSAMFSSSRLHSFTLDSSTWIRYPNSQVKFSVTRRHGPSSRPPCSRGCEVPDHCQLSPQPRGQRRHPRQAGAPCLCPLTDCAPWQEWIHPKILLQLHPVFQEQSPQNRLLWLFQHFWFCQIVCAILYNLIGILCKLHNSFYHSI